MQDSPAAHHVPKAKAFPFDTLMSDFLRFWFKHLSLMLALAALGLVPMVVMMLPEFFSPAFQQALTEGNSSAAVETLGNQEPTLLHVVASAFGMLIAALLSAYTLGCSTLAFVSWKRGRRLSVREALSAGWDVVGHTVPTGLAITALAMAWGFGSLLFFGVSLAITPVLLLLAIPASIALAIWFLGPVLIAVPIAALQREGVIGACTDALDYVDGKRWYVLGAAAIVLLCYQVVYMVAFLLLAALFIATIAGMVAGAALFGVVGVGLVTVVATLCLFFGFALLGTLPVGFPPALLLACAPKLAEVPTDNSTMAGGDLL